MTAKSVLKETQTILVAIAVAALLWLYAENENVKDRSDTVIVQLVSPPNAEQVIEPNERFPVVIGVRCSVSQLRELTSKPLELTVTADENNLTQTLNLRQLLENDPRFANKAIRVTDVRPPIKEITVERKVSVTLPVSVDVGDLPVDSHNPPVADPKSIPKLLTLSLARQIEKLGLGLEARLDPARLNGTQPNIRQEIQVPLTWKNRQAIPENLRPALDKLLADLPVAKVSFTLQNLTEDYAYEYAVPVFPAMEASDTDKYTITDKQGSKQLSVSNVVFSGPKDVIDRLKQNKEFQARAILMLSTADLEGAQPNMSKPVVFLNLPPGVSVKPPLPSVTFTVTKRQPPAAPAPITPPPP